MSATVYAHLDRSENMLYIGCSYRPGHRLNQHRPAAWWSEIDSVQICGVGSLDQMRDLEQRLIETFDPPHNVTHTRAWREAQPWWQRAHSP